MATRIAAPATWPAGFALADLTGLPPDALAGGLDEAGLAAVDGALYAMR
jgi:hypothetical protein